MTDPQPAGARHRCARPDANDARLRRRWTCPVCDRRWRIVSTVDGAEWKRVAPRARVWSSAGEAIVSEIVWVVIGRILWTVISAPFKLIGALLGH
ncbi:hypothetical protein ACFVTX_00450 [Agromyces sp. NPDC058136]|uniref:hypothetical protein n=1 Tax=Agromyces sp. NPDC058136 TaxID=3346354 RepID=UPI0036DF133C